MIVGLSSFSSSITPIATFNGYVAWFTVSFEGSQSTVTLSTSPESPYDFFLYYSKPLSGTHWRQCIFYFNEPREIEQDQPMSGNLTVSLNQEHDRLIDVTFFDKEKGNSNHFSMR
jgi:hypothetical protein